MAHFSVAVFSRRPEEAAGLMLPYDLRVTPGAPHALFQDHPKARVDALTGRPGFWVNPQCRFDWYNVGGRWAGMLRVNGHGGAVFHVNQARANDCDFSCDMEKYERAKNYWNFFLYGTPIPGGERAPVLRYKPNYYLDRFGNQEQYARAQAGFHTDTFIDEDGVWHEPVRFLHAGPEHPMTEEDCARYLAEMERQIKKAVDEWLFITVCDCHI